MASLASCDTPDRRDPGQAEPKSPPALKPCCACPETKRARDVCQGALVWTTSKTNFTEIGSSSVQEFSCLMVLDGVVHSLKELHHRKRRRKLWSSYRGAQGMHESLGF